MFDPATRIFTRAKSCEKSNLKKYVNRPGPPYPAQNCKNHVKKGNDGNKYKSTSDKNGIYKWKKL